MSLTHHPAVIRPEHTLHSSTGAHRAQPCTELNGTSSAVVPQHSFCCMGMLWSLSWLVHHHTRFTHTADCCWAEAPASTHTPSSVRLLSINIQARGRCTATSQEHGRGAECEDIGVAHRKAPPAGGAGITPVLHRLPRPNRLSWTHAVSTITNRGHIRPQHLDTHRHCRDYTMCQWGCSELPVAAQGSPKHPVKQWSHGQGCQNCAHLPAAGLAGQQRNQSKSHDVLACIAAGAPEGAGHRPDIEACWRCTQKQNPLWTAWPLHEHRPYSK
jgi:hypothetical protein